MSDTGLNVPCPMCGNNHGSHTWMCPWHPDNKKQAKVSTDLSEENKSLRDQLAQMTEEKNRLHTLCTKRGIELTNLEQERDDLKKELSECVKPSEFDAVAKAVKQMFEAELQEAREEIIKTIKNTDEKWVELYNKYAKLITALEAIADVRLEPAYCYEQSAFIQKIAVKALDQVLIPTNRREHELPKA